MVPDGSKPSHALRRSSPLGRRIKRLRPSGRNIGWVGFSDDVGKAEATFRSSVRRTAYLADGQKELARHGTENG
jgi:hypothetical protein